MAGIDAMDTAAQDQNISLESQSGDAAPIDCTNGPLFLRLPRELRDQVLLQTRSAWSDSMLTDHVGLQLCFLHLR